jgi:DnaK suppressor protein
VKAPATRTAKTAQPSASGAKGRPSAASSTGKTGAKLTAPAKAKAVKSPASPVATSKKVPASKAPAKKAAVKTVVKAAAKSTAKVIPKPAAKAAPAKSAAKAPVKAAVKPQPKSSSSSKSVPQKPTSPPVVASKSSVPTPPPVPSPTPKRAPAPAKAAAAPAPIEPTPRPLGKRAAKKVMMEQMTQAAVVPTHAPDAAKATFSTMNERAVMTPPVPSSIQKDPKRANNWKNLSVDKLTDQDVQAMPDSEYMNDVQLAFFRLKLTQLKEDMLANAGETTEHLREDTVVVPDPADRATIEEEHALELRTRDRERKLLKKIEQAIARIDSGDYGYCEETGEAIGVGRLMARPTASLSLEAQQRRELKQKMFGD